MPYIKNDRRIPLLNGAVVRTPGELNFLITGLCHSFLGKSPHYADFNEVVGVLECAKIELYRRWIGPYEDEQIAEHGDVSLR